MNKKIRVAFNNYYAHFEGSRVYFMTVSSYNRLLAIWRETKRDCVRSWYVIND